MCVYEYVYTIERNTIRYTDTLYIYKVYVSHTDIRTRGQIPRHTHPEKGEIGP